ncbi:hypothetical protein [Microbacterium hydrocarbonoxydans]|uniref:hypothetical protein n=1 Tax=Microbacterium hydrocarbonoxydans TaxID=273678 RepID=UPI000B3113E6|nr:hypothetical protein [Microbacterium hydrocarbonoxydans]
MRIRPLQARRHRTGGVVDAPALESLTNRQVGVPVSLGDLAALVPHHPNQEES